MEDLAPILREGKSTSADERSTQSRIYVGKPGDEEGPVRKRG